MYMRNGFILLLLIVSFLLFPYHILGNECPPSELQKLRQYASHVDIRHMYIKNYRLEGTEEQGDNIFVGNHFVISISNLQSNIIIIEAKTGQAFWYDANRLNPNVMALGGFIGGAQYTFNIYADTNDVCDFESLRVLNINLPLFNVYSNDDYCLGAEEHKFCDMWYSGPMFSSAEFYNELSEYREAKKRENDYLNKSKWDLILDYIMNNYVVILIVTIFCSLIIFLLVNYINKRRSIL